MVIFKKFKLRANSKNPSNEWAKATRNFRIPTENELKTHFNWGIPTGRINKIIVVDLDSHKEGFNFPFDFDNINTLQVKSISGGRHLYFKYDKDIKQTQNDKFQVDIRADGGYIVAPDTIINGKKYEIIKNTDIVEIPNDMKEWILDNLYNKKPTQQKSKHKTINDNQTEYTYNIPNDIIEEILLNLDDKYWDKLDDFLIYTTACKVLNKTDNYVFKLWDKINKTKPKYNYDGNIRIWNGAKNYQYCINKLFEDKQQIINYYKFKECMKNNRQPDEIINKQKLGYDYFKPKINYMIKSDTGTGKTTSFKHYVKNNNHPFISIVSRISLGDEQTEVFSREGLDVKFYQVENNFKTGDNVVITIDSIMKLYNVDFTKYILFLDEFNSLIEYLITSPTLNKTRLIVYQLFIKILNECKQIIGTDADINDISLRFLDFTTKKYNYICNEYLHNKGVNAYELESIDDMIEKLKKEDKFLLCCDSKEIAEAVKLEINDDKIIVITSDTQEYINLDSADKIIFSPKIIYGLDSSMKRNVYCFYKEHTINPTAYLQQIARCRNIINLFYCFNKKEFKPTEATYETINNQVIENNTAGCQYFKMLCPDVINHQYLELLTKYEYNNDCYKTNKFAHFIHLLDVRGFKRCNIKYFKTKNQLKEKIINKRENDNETFSIDIPKYKAIQDILNIPAEEIENYKDYFLNRGKLENHFRICKYEKMEYEEVIDIINETHDFNVNKIKTDKSKMAFLMEFKKVLGCDEKYDLEIRNKLTEKQQEYFYKKYNNIFSNKKKADFKTEKSQLKYLVEIYKRLFGKDIVETSRVGKARATNYNINNEYILEHQALKNYRKTKINYDECLIDGLDDNIDEMKN